MTIVEIFDASDIEIRDLFLRLQEGVSLNPAEKRNAFVGGMRDFIAELAAVHDCIVKNTESPVTGHDGLMSTVLALAARKSLAEKRTVKPAELMVN